MNETEENKLYSCIVTDTKGNTQFPLQLTTTDGDTLPYMAKSLYDVVKEADKRLPKENLHLVRFVEVEFPEDDELETDERDGSLSFNLILKPVDSVLAKALQERLKGTKE